MEIGELGEEPLAAALLRLRKVEGQVRAVQRMIEDGRQCEDVLRQISAATKALKRTGVHLAVSGLQHCVVDGTKDSAESLEQFRKSFVELS
jgi:CsoR family transcriptional regulator, copper-sensing transcriptional repressor